MIKKIGKIITNVLIIAILFFSLFTIIMGLIGFKWDVVLSGSMEPDIHVGSLNYRKYVSFESLNIDDDVVYKSKSSGDLITHRIIDIDYEKKIVVTQGINGKDSGAAKEEVDYTRIVGKSYFSIPLIGYVAFYFKKYFVAIILFVIAALLIYQAIKLFKTPTKEEN